MKKIPCEFASSPGKLSYKDRWRTFGDGYIGCRCCEHYTEKMFKFQSGLVICEDCKGKYHKDELATAESMLTDAVFNCPAEACAAKLSFSEFFGGECCNRGCKDALEFEFVEYVNQKDVAEGFDYARKNEVITKREQKKAKRVFEELEKKMEKAKKDLEKKESKAREATNKRKKIQKEMREAFLSAAHELRDPDQPEENRTECSICLEEYNGDDRRESVLHCGHRSCYNCLHDLPKKLCPICRKKYTVKQIIKFF